MAYDEYMAERITRFFDDKKSNYFTKKMFGGLCFMVEDKMCVAVLYNKKHATDFLLARVGEDGKEASKDRDGAQEKSFMGRPMKGYVFVTPEGYDTDEDLEYWLNLCLDFNPLAKMSKKRKKIKKKGD